jgi:microcystin-dependent protein
MEGIFIGQIMLWSGDWVPDGFLKCDGSTYNMGQYPALGSILGYQWGGTPSANTFKVPNFQGKTLAGCGSIPLLPNQPPLTLSQNYAGTPTASLSVDQMPIHNHSVTIPNANQAVQAKAVVSNLNATASDPTGLLPAAGVSPSPDGLDINLYTPQTGATTIGLNNAVKLNISTSLTSLTLAATGNTVPHNNMQPYLSMYYIIAWNGLYPEFQD